MRKICLLLLVALLSFILIACGKENTKEKKEEVSQKTEETGKLQAINVFDEIKVAITGISPKVVLNVINDSDEEYMKGITFAVEPQGYLEIGDKVTVVAQIDDDVMAGYGKRATTKKQEYVIGEVSRYPEGTWELDNETIQLYSEKNQEIINQEAADTTKHLIWRITGDSKYLMSSSIEMIQSCELKQVYYLKGKDSESSDTDNYLYYIYEAVVSNEKNKQTGYFLFEYKDIYLDSDDIVMNEKLLKERYQCSEDLEELYQMYIGNKKKDFIVMDYMIEK